MTHFARCVVIAAICSGCLAGGTEPKEPVRKEVIGATARLVEAESGLGFVARIDTGAASCSIHAEDVRVENADGSMRKNVGKKVRFLLRNAAGETMPIDTTIAGTVRVKTSDEDASERRYKVWLTLRYGDIERRVHVTLNDRAHMKHPLLIGRNFLKGRFLVDVEQELTDGAG